MAEQVLIGGKWRDACFEDTFAADDPRAAQSLPAQYPVSTWADCDEALDAAAAAFQESLRLPAASLADFLECYAQLIEDRRDALVECAHRETALPASPRLADIELPRTTGQLRQAAAAARSGSWAQATIDTATNIRSCFAPLGPVLVFGPNNFPFAFGSISGGDFAAAIAAGNPVIAKANSSHPGTTKLFAEAALQATEQSAVPNSMVQLIYRTAHSDGLRLVADPRVGATGYTGSRTAGLRLKAAADAAGKPIYLELSSVNPVVVLPGALAKRGEEIAQEFVGSCLMGTGQFCTNPGLVMLPAGAATDRFLETVAAGFDGAAVGTLLSRAVQQSLSRGIETLCRAGAEPLTGQPTAAGEGYCVPNTWMKVSGDKFLASPGVFQTEMFGNASLCVVAQDFDELEQCLWTLEGNLTGCVYSDAEGSDDEAYDRLAPVLRQRVGRLLNDKMPTGVAVSPAMNHGGPYPSTGHPGFTAVGIPAALRRFAMLQSFDGVREGRLPAGLRDKNPTGDMWRCIDGRWTCDSI